MAGNCDPTGRRRGKIRIEVARDRNRIKAPKTRNITIKAVGPVVSLSNQMAAVNLNAAGKEGWTDPHFALSPAVLPASARCMC